MKLNLTKPLIIFDLETTGLDLVKDRIIQISYIKVYPDGKEERGNELINPERHIEPIITQLTGISDEDVKDKPTFKQIAQRSVYRQRFCRFQLQQFRHPPAGRGVSARRHRLRLLEMQTHRCLFDLQKDGASQLGRRL